MMRLQKLAFLLGAASALAAPHLAERADKVTDTELLQFAMTLELLENTFYHEALDKFDDKAFADAGFPSWVRGRFLQIKQHEETHVDFLRGILGDKAPQACEYNFPYNDPRSFAALSMALETVGQSAYMGAARLIEDKDTLTDAASIMTVEGRQAAWVGSAVLKGTAWDGPFETPLSANGVYSLASQFIIKCPESNPQLPVTVLPKLTIDPSAPYPGDVVKFNFKREELKVDGAPLFVAFFNGIYIQFADLGSDNTAVVPGGVQGTVYAAIVKTKASMPELQELLTGLVMFEVAFPSYVGNP